MREMVLNHSSLRSPDQNSSVEWLNDLIVGMSELVQNEVVQKSLRMSCYLHETLCLANWSLLDVCRELNRRGEKDKYMFFVTLTNKVPLLADIDPDVRDRFLSCESKTLPSPDGDPLVLCAIKDSIAVGFPSDPIWDKDQITVSFDELAPAGNIQEASEEIDNLTRYLHAGPICDRHRTDLYKCMNPPEVWNKRQWIFPNIVFGPGVKRCLENLDSNALRIVIKRLDSIDRSAGRWRIEGGAAPEWKCNVTTESESVKKNPKLRKARQFQSHNGKVELFEWHARFGSSGRIHLRLDSHSYEVEIGYIGPHLPV